jgi:hypothetical protein
MVTSPAGVGPENEYAGECQQQFHTTDSSYRQRGCYKRTTKARIQLEKRILVLSLKGLVAKTNCLASRKVTLTLTERTRSQ